MQTDEVFFRDTAHGFLVWAVGLVIAAAFLGSAATSLIGGAAKVGAAGAAALSSTAVFVTETGAAARSDSLQHNAYLVDILLRTDRPEGVDASARVEVARVFAQGLGQQDISAANKTYLAKFVSAKTGLSRWHRI